MLVRSRVKNIKIGKSEFSMRLFISIVFLTNLLSTQHVRVKYALILANLFRNYQKS